MIRNRYNRCPVQGTKRERNKHQERHPVENNTRGKQEDISFPVDGHQAIIKKATPKTKADNNLPKNDKTNKDNNNNESRSIQTTMNNQAPSNLIIFYVGTFIKPEVQPAGGAQLKKEAKLLTEIGLATKHAVCRNTSPT